MQQCRKQTHIFSADSIVARQCIKVTVFFSANKISYSWIDTYFKTFWPVQSSNTEDCRRKFYDIVLFEAIIIQQLLQLFHFKDIYIITSFKII